MSQVTLKGNPIRLQGEMVPVGAVAPDFEAVKVDLSTVKLSDYKGKKVVLNIFPSIDTGVCAQSVRTFNKEASNLENTVVLCLSKDLPFAMARFCGTEGLENVVPVSLFRSKEFDAAYNLLMVEGPLAALTARAVIVVNEEGKVVYTELVPEIAQEPDYAKAIAALK
ncbi:MAG: thiol peroxidase [Porphyromonas sp.]|nr:thiol peroxidase [Porphyromonas sp.]